MGKEEESSKDTSTVSGTPPSQPPSDVKTSKEPEQEKKTDVNNLRTVIKVNQEETPTKQEEKTPPEKPKEKSTTIPKPTPTPDIAMPEDAKSELEQRRNILRSIKDFDFLIKKNQEDVNKLTEQVNGLTNDLDDLVSLYEIVSEQMNPFVGLSKVTKKRLDALENFTKEVEDVKTKIGDLESEMEKVKGSVRTGQIFQAAHQQKIPPVPQKPETPGDKPSTPMQPAPNTSVTPVSFPPISGRTSPIPLSTTSVSPVISTSVDQTQTLSDSELDILFGKSMEALFYEEQIDSMISEFLLSLK